MAGNGWTAVHGSGIGSGAQEQNRRKAGPGQEQNHGAQLRTSHANSISLPRAPFGLAISPLNQSVTVARSNYNGPAMGLARPGGTSAVGPIGAGMMNDV